MKSSESKGSDRRESRVYNEHRDQFTGGFVDRRHRENDLHDFSLMPDSTELILQ